MPQSPRANREDLTVGSEYQKYLRVNLTIPSQPNSATDGWEREFRSAPFLLSQFLIRSDVAGYGILDQSVSCRTQPPA